MTKIALLSDTHHYMDAAILQHTANCHEIWHAGDFGTAVVADQLAATGKVVRGVYGNIDGNDIRQQFPEIGFWQIEEVRVLMLHIGGYPPKYNAQSKKLIAQYQPHLFISGHSHILKVMYDEAKECLHINPGAAGKQGWHTVRTMVRFVIDGNQIQQLEIIELGGR